MIDDLRGSPMQVGTLEEIVDDEHAIVSSAAGPEYYVPIMSFVDKDLLEPNCSVLLHHKSLAIIGVLQNDTDPTVSVCCTLLYYQYFLINMSLQVMKLEKAPSESYADVGGLDQQIQEIKVCLFTFIP